MIVPLRSNPALWFAPLVTLGIVVMWATVIAPLQPDPYWTAYVSLAADGLQYGLPFAAVGSAWAAWRVRDSGPPATRPVRNPLGVYWRHTYPLFLAVFLGLAIAVAGEFFAQRPEPTMPNLLLLLTYAAMTFFATGIGWIFGMLLPLALALPLSLIATFQWAVYPLADGSNVSYRNIMGYALFGCCSVANREPTMRALVAPVVMAGAMAVVIYLSLRLRRLPWAVSGLAVLIVASAGANLLVTGTDAYGGQLRNSEAMICSGSAPEVCLFEEMGTPAQRDAVVTTLRQSYTSAASQGIALPGKIVMESVIPQDRLNVTQLIATGSMDDVAVRRSYATGLMASLNCAPIASTDPQLPAGLDVQFALEVLLGNSFEQATPEVYASDSEGGPSEALSSEDLQTILGINSVEDAREKSLSWLDEQTSCAKGIE